MVTCKLGLVASLALVLVEMVESVLVELVGLLALGSALEWAELALPSALESALELALALALGLALALALGWATRSHNHSRFESRQMADPRRHRRHPLERTCCRQHTLLPSCMRHLERRCPGQKWAAQVWVQVWARAWAPASALPPNYSRLHFG